MKKCNKLAALALAALALSACCDQASIRGTLADAPGRTVAVKQLDINTFRDLDTIKVGTDGSFLSPSQLANALSAVPGRVIVLLDSCHSGALIGRDGEVTQATAADLDAFNQSVISAFAACDSTIVFEQSELMLDEESGEPVSKSGELDGQTKFIVITAASMSESSYSQTSGEMSYGLFTKTFVEGCGSGYPGGSYTGSIPCDSNGDSQISVSEIYYYVKSITGNKQHAQCYAADMSEVMFMR